MVDFVGDIIRNAYNADAANWRAPALQTVAPIAGSRTVTTPGTTRTVDAHAVPRSVDPKIFSMGDEAVDYRNQTKNRASRAITTDPTTSTQNYWTVNGKEYADQAAAQAAAEAYNSGLTPASNPYNTGLAGYGLNELLQSGYIDNIAQGRGLVFNPQSSYAAQKAIAMDQFGDDALTAAIMKAAGAGVDTSPYLAQAFMDPYISSLGQRADSRINVSDDTSTVYDFGGVFNTQAAQDIVDQIVADERQRAQDTINTQGGFGYNQSTGQSEYSRNLFNDSLDDAFVDDILTKQYGTGRNTLERALSYGQISDAGLDAALTGLDTQRTGAETQIGDYSSGVLNEYRGLTDTDIGNLYNTAGALSLGQNFDASGSISDIQNKANERVGGFEGALRNEFGDQQFFDIGTLLAEGAKNSGIFDPVGQGVGPIKKDDEKKSNQRGLGSQGSF